MDWEVMAGRDPRGKNRHRPIPVYQLAMILRKWVVMGKNWYTPEEHFQQFGKGLSLPKDSWTLADPMVALKEGQEKIIRMIEDEVPKGKIINAQKRLYKFMNKILEDHSKKNI